MAYRGLAFRWQCTSCDLVSIEKADSNTGNTHTPAKEEWKMNRFEDKRIEEALEMLNAVARDHKTELQTTMENKYADLSSVVRAFTDEVKSQASEKIDNAKHKVGEIATDIDKSAHKNPWAFIGGAAAVGLALGFLLGRSRRS
jgi:ElaB/YqjD/DUF883 family membrane-anchored ribosome-binding protein